MRSLLLAAMLVARSASAFELSPPTQTGPAEYAGAPRIATDGDLVAWGDERPRPSDEREPLLAIRAMFLDAEGRPRADRDFEVVPAPSLERFETPFSVHKHPLAVASNGHGYLVAYNANNITRFVHVSEDGKIHPRTRSSVWAAALLRGMGRLLCRGGPGVDFAVHGPDLARPHRPSRCDRKRAPPGRAARH